MSRPELLRALGSVSESPPRTELASSLDLGPVPPVSEHTEVFLMQLHPVASVHLGAEGMLGGEAAARVAGFWRTLGISPPNPPDHLSPLLAGYAELQAEASRCEGKRHQSITRAAQVLLWEHLASWAPVFLQAVISLGQTFYALWAELTLQALVEETGCVPEWDALPTALRLAPEPLIEDLPRPELVRQLLSPIRSGVVVTRDDLRRACGQLSIGMRQGERAYVLSSMLDQDAGSTLAWMADHARVWIALHGELLGSPLGVVATWWQSRAALTAVRLDGLVPER